MPATGDGYPNSNSVKTSGICSLSALKTATYPIPSPFFCKD
jgi:hypothetical protein